MIVTPKIPKHPDPIDRELSREEAEQYMEDKKILQTTAASLYNIVWGQ